MEIFIDSREDGAVFGAFRRATADPALLKTLKLKEIKITQENNMLSGDFVCGEYALEHKSPNDYRKSIMEDHLQDQMLMMKKNFKDCAILYSGQTFELFRDMLGQIDKFGTGTFASFAVQGIPVYPCGDLDVMAVVAIKMLHKWNDGKVRDHNPNINQKLHDDVQMNIITAIPGIGESHGAALLAVFPTIEEIVAASIDELTKVDGIGSKRAMEIYNAFHGVRW
jgi:ERCC4-type nuclease